MINKWWLDQIISEKEIKIFRTKWKWTHNIIKPLGCYIFSYTLNFMYSRYLLIDSNASWLFSITLTIIYPSLSFIYMHVSFLLTFCVLSSGLAMFPQDLKTTKQNLNTRHEKSPSELWSGLSLHSQDMDMLLLLPFIVS